MWRGSFFYFFGSTYIEFESGSRRQGYVINFEKIPVVKNNCREKKFIEKANVLNYVKIMAP